MSLEPPKNPTPTHRLARHIEVRRDKGDPSVRVYIDGELVPYFLTGDGVKVEPRFGQPGQVTLTLVAERITVEDEFLLGQGDDLDLDHDHDEAPAPAPVYVDAVPQCTLKAACPLDAGHPGPCL